MSSFLKCFNAIKTQIETVSAIKTVRLWNSQIENYERERAYERPAAFVEFLPSPCTTQQKIERVGQNISRQQKIDLAITIHVEFDKLEDETTSFPLIDATFQAVYYALQGFYKDSSTLGYFKPLRRTEVRFDVNHDEVIDWQMDFSTMMEEMGEQDDLTLIAGGTLTPEITRTLDIDNDIIRTGDGE